MEGLIHLYCGDGKGKTTAAVGLAVRAAGAGLPVVFAQFFKNGSSGEISLLRQLPGVRVLVCAQNPGRFSRMTEHQRSQARDHDVVMDGRDIGTVVLPQAGVKVFLTAAPEARAQRRLAELLQRGQQAQLDGILADIIRRDEQDRTRPVAPLRQAEDAVLLDTTDLDLEGSLAALESIVRERLSL